MIFKQKIFEAQMFIPVICTMNEVMIVISNEVFSF